MKKQFMMVSVLLITMSGLDATAVKVTANGVLQRFNASFGGLFGQGYLFDKKNIANQNAVIDQWNLAVSMAKSFVIENCKNLVGIKDSDLVDAMAKIETANINLINSIKITRNATLDKKTLQKQENIMKEINNDMRNLAKLIESKFFALDNKKEAQRVIVAVATYVESGADKAKKDIQKLLLG